VTAEQDPPRWRQFLINRFVLAPAVIALLVLIWNIYVVTHASGIVRGRVIGPDGEPVAGAAVTLWARNFTTYVERARAVSDESGRFTIAGNDSHDIQLAAAKPGLGRSPRLRVRLYFRAQEVRLAEPLRLAPES
jgi:Carboxypeptidase regulatory-like domain